MEVVVLLATVEPATIESLVNVGFEHEATADQRSFVLGRITLVNLEALALLEAVRRVEPAECEASAGITPSRSSSAAPARTRGRAA